MVEEPRFLLIVSDLHLSEGWDPDTKRLSRNEDFYFDASFARFLSAQAESAVHQGYRLRLIIPGDLVDFLQVTAIPPGDSLDGEPITARDRQFGLGTSPAHTCWKLRRIVSGHWLFFDALARFVGAGQDLVVLPGNHDIEWVIPEVQAAFISELSARAPVAGQDAVAERIRFLPWFYLEPGLIYVDHGHQYDPLNSFDYFLHPYLPDGRIDLPAGSFFVRYLFNKVETAYPFADNMKPSSRFVRWVLWRILRNPRRWPQLRPFIGFFWETLKKAGSLEPSWRSELEARQQAALDRIAADFGLGREKAMGLKNLWVPSAIHMLSKPRLACMFFGQAGGAEPLTTFADRITALLGVRYVVFGHTHDADLQPLPSGPPRAEYVNSGTWTRVFAANFEERLLKEESEFVYVLVDRTKPKIELLRWRDDLGEGERVRLFQRASAT